MSPSSQIPPGNYVVSAGGHAILVDASAIRRVSTPSPTLPQEQRPRPHALPYVAPGATVETMIRRLQEAGVILLTAGLPVGDLARYIERNGENGQIRADWFRLRDEVAAAQRAKHVLQRRVAAETPTRRQEGQLAVIPWNPATSPRRAADAPLPAPRLVRRDISAPVLGALQTAPLSPQRAGVVQLQEGIGVLGSIIPQTIAVVSCVSKAHVSRKTNAENFSAICSRMEGFVRQYFTGAVFNPGAHKSLQAIVHRASMHCEDGKMAIEILRHTDLRHLMLTGILIRGMVEHIFQQSLLDRFTTEYSSAYKNLWKQAHSAAGDTPTMELVNGRLDTFNDLCSMAQKIIGHKRGGFWSWLSFETDFIAERFLRDCRYLIPRHQVDSAVKEMKNIIGNCMRLAIGMRTRPTLIEYVFYTFGMPWEADKMITRNPGQEPSNQEVWRYAVMFTVVPYIVERSIRLDRATTTVRRPEVILLDKASLFHRSARSKNPRWGTVLKS